MNRVLCRTALFLSIVALMVAMCGSAQASLIIGHYYSYDPATEGWTGVNGGVSAGTVGPSIDSGVYNWKMAETSNASQDYYTTTITSAQQTAMATDGWTAEVKVNAFTSGVSSDWANYFEVDTPLNTYVLEFKTDAGGNPLLYQGYPFVQIPIGSVGPGFHTYAMTAAPGSSNVTVSVDGSPVLTGWSGVASWGSGMLWGRGSALAATSTFGYEEAVLYTGSTAPAWPAVPTPEPSTIVLLMTGMVALLAYAWRRRR
jgi:hypothetical protein